MAKPLIEFKHISKAFGKKKVLEDISFSVEEGDIFGIVGISGAGKTTLLRILVGYYESNKGKILFRNGQRRPAVL